jgi:hypothetical protein
VAAQRKTLVGTRSRPAPPNGQRVPAHSLHRLDRRRRPWYGDWRLSAVASRWRPCPWSDASQAAPLFVSRGSRRSEPQDVHPSARCSCRGTINGLLDPFGLAVAANGASCVPSQCLRLSAHGGREGRPAGRHRVDWRARLRTLLVSRLSVAGRRLALCCCCSVGPVTISTPSSPPRTLNQLLQEDSQAPCTRRALPPFCDCVAASFCMP